MEKDVTAKIQRRFTGTVASTGMEKTISVVVERTKVHPIYRKRFKTSTKYLVHDEKETAKVGDVVEFAECRPISKRKRWRLTKIVK